MRRQRACREPSVLAAVPPPCPAAAARAGPAPPPPTCRPHTAAGLGRRTLSRYASPAWCAMRWNAMCCRQGGAGRGSAGDGSASRGRGVHAWQVRQRSRSGARCSRKQPGSSPRWLPRAPAPGRRCGGATSTGGTAGCAGVRVEGRRGGGTWSDARRWRAQGGGSQARRAAGAAGTLASLPRSPRGAGRQGAAHRLLKVRLERVVQLQQVPAHAGLQEAARTSRVGRERCTSAAAGMRRAAAASVLQPVVRARPVFLCTEATSERAPGLTAPRWLASCRRARTERSRRRRRGTGCRRPAPAGCRGCTCAWGGRRAWRLAGGKQGGGEAAGGRAAAASGRLCPRPPPIGHGRQHRPRLLLGARRQCLCRPAHQESARGATTSTPE